MSANRRWPSLLAAALLTACATNSAPPGFLPTPTEAQTQAWGGWIELRYLRAGSERRADGELIAASPDSVWILGAFGGVVVPTVQVTAGKLTGYSPQAGNVAGAAFLGTISTISNGALLVFTAPLWIITGTIAASDQSRAPERSVRQLAWSELTIFARFPQGMPAGLRLEDLRPKAGF
jgi:hypothetical protein